MLQILSKAAGRPDADLSASVCCRVLTSSAGVRYKQYPSFRLVTAVCLRHGPDLRRVTIQENGETQFRYYETGLSQALSSGSRTILDW
jgi:hypothetical protein